MTLSLPIDAVLPQTLQSLGTQSNLVLQAESGAGKTTRVPPALLTLFPGQVLVLEPRRLAARMAARRVAEEMGERFGETVGYQVRFEDVTGPRTRLRFLTEGVLNRRLLGDPELLGVDAVVLDEFHERHLDGDLALALLRRLQLRKRPNLRLVVMSATLDAAPLVRYLGDCENVRSEGRLFPVAIEYAGYSAASLEDQVAASFARALTTSSDGHILVFLPGAAEIRRAMRACEDTARRADIAVLPLYGDLSPEEQDRAVRPSRQRKLIVSTNVAESSVTIDGVTVVIDSGLERVSRDSPWTGLPTLEVQRTSKASATQRAGRAGRTAPGRAIRLYSAEDFVRRPDRDRPEISRRELSQVLLDLRAMGVDELPWFEAPPEEAVATAGVLLDRLGAAEYGTRMAQLPLHPRLARLVIEAKEHGAGAAGCTVAAVLSSGERQNSASVLDALDRAPTPRVQQLARQIRKQAGVRDNDRGTSEDVEKAILTAFPDRVGRRRANQDVQLSSGQFASLAPGFTGEFLVAIDIEDRREQATPLIRLAAPIQADWLLDMFPDRMRDRSEVLWNRTAERVESVSALLYDELVIEETRSGNVDAEAAAALLAAKAIEAGIERFVDPELLESFLARVEFASQYGDVAPILSEDVRSALEELCYGLKSFAELRSVAREETFLGVLRRRMPPAQQRLLDEIAPDRLPLRGRQVRIHYVRGQSPWMASRLQDFFGLTETPKLARGKVPVLLHLLAPNQRPVQMTTDLAGFWKRLYPQVRQELCRRYPRHAWPENPLTAAPRT